MGIFDKFKKKDEVPAEEKGKIFAPIAGRYIPLADIPDEVFSQGILGQGCGVEPEEGKVYAPVSGEITTVADTKHAIGILCAEGGEFLIHVGIDTVDMNGDGFSPKVKKGDRVKMGQLLLEFDPEKIKAASHPTTTAFLLTNSDDYPNFSLRTGEIYPVKAEIGTI